MNKLEKWLWSNCTLKDNGQTSNSLYFKYGVLEVRYSDHQASTSTGDLQIIQSSVYDSTVYAVILKGSAKIMIANAAQIIAFIKHQSIVKELLTTTTIKCSPSNKEINALILPESLFKPYKTDSKNVNKILFKGKEPWSNAEIKYLKQAVIQYFKQSCGFTTVFTNYLKDNRVSYVEAINLYKTIVFDNKQIFTLVTIDKVLKYINSINGNSTSQMY